MTTEQLNDPLWRLCNLYWIVDKSSNLVRFVPNEIQLDFIKHMGYRNIILKARQLGFSTLIQLMILDQCIFLPNVHAGIIAQDDEAAAAIFADKIKVAWDNMPAWVKKRVQSVGDSVRELRLSNGSWIRVATSLRSSTLQYLHVSEFGKICAKYPHKAKEVMTGSIPAVPNDGFVFIESTAEGREGKFYELVTECQKRKKLGIKPGPKDFRLHFYSWFDCTDYVQEWPEEVTEDDRSYFQTIADQAGIELTPEQQYWYIATRRQNFAGDSHMMRQEYPSMPDEAFEKSTEGKWFTTQIALLHKERRITQVSHMRGVPVETAWDIGRTDGTAIWLFQRVGLDFRMLNFVEGHNLDYDIYVARLQELQQTYGYVYGRHFLPHDANHVRQAKTKSEAKSPEQILKDLGLTNTKIVPQTLTKFSAIQRARTVMPQCYFDEENCAAGIVHLEEYKKKWSTALAMWIDEPVHDNHSEASDAFMQMACGWTPRAQVDKSKFAAANDRVTNPFAARR